MLDIRDNGQVSVIVGKNKRDTFTFNLSFSFFLVRPMFLESQLENLKRPKCRDGLQCWNQTEALKKSKGENKLA